MPKPIFLILEQIRKLHSIRNYSKYQYYWTYSPTERIADISGNSLVLTLIEQAENKQQLEAIKQSFEESIEKFLFYGYDRLLGPTNFYLSRFKQYKDCIKILEMSKSLSVEERLLLGLHLNSEEFHEAKQNKEKILTEIRKMC